MGIQVEYNPDLALRHIAHYEHGHREREECIPPELEVDRVYAFLKSGQRLYWLLGEIPLLGTEGEGRLSRPVASIEILESTHFLRDGEVWTKGRYRVREIFNHKDPTVHFEGFSRVRRE